MYFDLICDDETYHFSISSLTLGHCFRQESATRRSFPDLFDLNKEVILQAAVLIVQRRGVRHQSDIGGMEITEKDVRGLDSYVSAIPAPPGNPRKWHSAQWILVVMAMGALISVVRLVQSNPTVELDATQARPSLPR